MTYDGDLNRVVFLRQQNLTFREIAKKLNISHSVAVRDNQAWEKERSNVEGYYDS